MVARDPGSLSECELCGSEFRQAATGRPRRFCTNGCLRTAQFIRGREPEIAAFLMATRPDLFPKEEPS